MNYWLTPSNTSYVSIHNLNLYIESILKYVIVFHMLTVIVLLMVYKKTIMINLRHKYHPGKIPDSIFPNITYADINKGIPEFLMYLVNDGFYLFGMEVSCHRSTYLN